MNRKKSIIAGIIIVIISIFSIMFSLLNMGNDKIYNKITIGGIKVSEMKEQQAIEEITKEYNDKKTGEIKLKHNEFELTISYDQLGVESKINKAVEKAYSIGRKGNIITNNYAILLRNFINKNIEIEYKIDEDSLNSTINDIESKLPDVEIDASYSIEGNELIISKGKDGVKVKKEELKDLIIAKIKNITDKDNTIEIPVNELKPEEINIEKIAEEIKKEPQDAYISKDPLEVHADEAGIELAVTIEEAKEILNETKEEYTIPLKITEANKKVTDLGEDAFPNLLATYTTNYDASNINRNNNLVLAAENLSNTVINPGEEFSYNKVVGKRTIENGFKEAKAYAGGKVVLDVGGGICQLSSTLYNTAMLTNLEITERHNHCFQTAYLPAGRDATVSWGSLDFKFKNNRKYPIKIIATAGEGVVKVDIYGIKQEDDYTVLFESQVTNVIDQKIEYQEDNTLKPGEEVVIQKGEGGCTSESYKTLLKNGVVISKTLVSKDTYNPLAKIIKRNS